MNSMPAFLLAATALAVTPGPGIAYVMARTAAGGRAEGLASCLGTGLGGLVHVTAAALGLSLLIARSALAFSVVKYAGAAYLIFLGLRLLLRRAPAQTPQPVRATSPRRAFRDGVMVEALNVKTALFFLAFLPQFADAARPLAAQLALLGIVCVALNTAADVAVALATDRLLRLSAVRQARGQLLSRVSGATMLGIGTWLALAGRDT